MFVAGRIAHKDDEANNFGFLELLAIDKPKGGKNGLRKAIAEKYNGSEDQFAIAQLTNEEAKRAFQDEFVLQWSGSKIIGLDFSAEDNKKIIKFEFSKKRIKADGIDSVDLKATIYKKDGTTVADVNKGKIFDMVKAGRNAEIELNFVSGIAEINGIVLNESGEYRIPVSKKVDEGKLRVQKVAKLSATHVFRILT